MATEQHNVVTAAAALAPQIRAGKKLSSEVMLGINTTKSVQD